MENITLRKAKVKDAKEIYHLINEFAKKGIMLPRSLQSIYEHIRDFFVIEKDKKIIATCALCIFGEDLGEIRSLAVRENYHKMGLGTKLVKVCIKEAKELGLKKIFTLTYQVEFFKKLGFKVVDKETLPQKIWKDCLYCPKFPNCDETALIYDLKDFKDKNLF